MPDQLACGDVCVCLAPGGMIAYDDRDRRVGPVRRGSQAIFLGPRRQSPVWKAGTVLGLFLAEDGSLLWIWTGAFKLWHRPPGGE